VIVLGLFMFNRGLVNFGYQSEIISPISEEQLSRPDYEITGDVKEYQIVEMDLTFRGYSPNVLFVKKDIPVRWIVNVQQMTGCTDEIIMPEYNIKKTLGYGENIIEFTPDKLGDIKFSCWMEMVWGKFVVTEKGEQPDSEDLYEESLDLPSGDGCKCGCSSR